MKLDDPFGKISTYSPTPLLELKRIQTFPDNYILKGTENNMIKQIGNAVPCNLAYHIGKHIKYLLSQDQ